MYIQFAELPVVDQDRALRFYRDKLGCTVAADTPMGQDGWRWIELAFAGARTRLHFVRRAAAAAEEPVLVLVADDVEGEVAALGGRGVDIIATPHRPQWEPDRLVAEIRDSEGNRLMISSP